MHGMLYEFVYSESLEQNTSGNTVIIAQASINAAYFNMFVEVDGNGA